MDPRVWVAFQSLVLSLASLLSLGILSVSWMLISLSAWCFWPGNKHKVDLILISAQWYDFSHMWAQHSVMVITSTIHACSLSAGFSGSCPFPERTGDFINCRVQLLPLFLFPELGPNPAPKAPFPAVCPNCVDSWLEAGYSFKGPWLQKHSGGPACPLAHACLQVPASFSC